jgi:hypothetical protein
VEASGYLYDMRNYEEKGKVKHYSNYPYNDLGPDKLNYNESGNTPTNMTLQETITHVHQNQILLP